MKNEVKEVTRRYHKCNKCCMFVLVDSSEPDEPYCTKYASTIHYKMIIPCEVKHNTVEGELQ